MLTIRTLHALKDNFIYLVVSDDGSCAVVDPGEDSVVLEYVRKENLMVKYVLCTHHHGDHIDGTPSLVAEHGCEVWVSSYDRKRIPFATKSLFEKDYDLFGNTMRVLEIPGHTLGHIGLYFPSLNSIFVGDTVFSAGCGRLFEGTPEMMFASLQKIKTLPADTKIYFGHEYTMRNLEFVEHYGGAKPQDLKAYKDNCQNQLDRGHDTTPSTVEQELRINPFFCAQSVDEFKKWRERRNTW